MSDRASVNSQWNYDAKVNLIEEIIAEIEIGNLPLEQIFEKFTIAVEHLRDCETFLAQGQQDMKLLIETLSDAKKSDTL